MFRITLFFLVILGTWSSGKLSWQHHLSGSACPILGIIPACYLAFAGYLMMMIAIIFRSGGPFFYWLFWCGLFIAGGLALLGSVMELVKGNICPRTYGWLPMCFISLGFSVLVGVLFGIVSHEPIDSPTTQLEQSDEN
ncbi:MAG: hypothetical protein QM501_11770 [Gimesia sp.]